MWGAAQDRQEDGQAVQDQLPGLKQLIYMCVYMCIYIYINVYIYIYIYIYTIRYNTNNQPMIKHIFNSKQQTDIIRPATSPPPFVDMYIYIYI